MDVEHIRSPLTSVSQDDLHLNSNLTDVLKPLDDRDSTLP